MNFRYYLGALLAIPLLPLMYIQGKRIKARVPELPEAAGLEGKAEVTSAINAEQSIRLITVGESTIAGVGVATHEEGFTGTLAKALSELLDRTVDWKVYARSGYTAAKVAEKMLPRIKEQQIDLIVIGLGGNDTFTLNSPRGWRRDMRGLIEGLRLKYPTSPIVFCNMPPIKEFPAFTPLMKFVMGNLVELFGAVLADLVNAHENVYYYGEIITLEKWIERLQIGAKNADFFSDGVHPSMLTYQSWAKDIANHIAGEVALKKSLLK